MKRQRRVHYVAACAALLLLSSATPALAAPSDFDVQFDNPTPGVLAAKSTTVDLKTSQPQDDTLPKDITGDAQQSEERSRIQGLLLPLEAYDGFPLWNSESQILTVRMTSAEALAEAKRVVQQSSTWLTVEYVLTKYSGAELDALSVRLLENQKEWAGATGMGGGHDILNNTVTIDIPTTDPNVEILTAAVRKLNDPRITLNVLDPIGGGPESRHNDYSPWAGGVAVTPYVTDPPCTANFAWSRWSNGERVLTSASHCQSGGATYNNGVWVGNVSSGDWETDSAIISGSAYSKKVFVGGSNTNILRPVVSVDTAWHYGEVVAVSGAASGGPVAYVKYSGYTMPAACSPEFAPTKPGVLMQSHVTTGGDSEAPWLTTDGAGDVIAHGQHWGHGCIGTNTGSFFVKLNDISAAQQLTLVLS